MSAELRKLIIDLQQQGFAEAADYLAVAKAQLEARELIPSHLEAHASSRAVPSDDIHRAYMRREIVTNEFGYDLRLRHVPLDLEERYDIDAFGFSPRVRNALVRSGITTQAEVAWLLEGGLIGRIRDLGEKGINEIRDKTRYPTS